MKKRVTSVSRPPKRHIVVPLSAAQIRAQLGVTAKDMKEVREIMAKLAHPKRVKRRAAG
jgi:hypothetical protein